jgi:hypothetical protein
MQMPSFKSIMANAVAVLCIAAAGAAQADVVVSSANANSDPHAFFDLVNAPPSTPPYLMIQLDINISGNANPLLNGTFYGFCIEPGQLTSLAAYFDPNVAGSGTGDFTYTTTFVTVSPVVQRLFDLHFGASKAGGDAGAAFNLALQELLLETSGSYSLEDGSYVRVGSGAYDKAASDAGSALLATVLTESDAPVHLRPFITSSPGSQDMMSALPPEGMSDVPEPASAALMLGALGAMGFVGRRRRRG